MIYVYVLQSLKDKNLYIGCTHDLKKRFSEHNKGKSFSTEPRKPFRLVYYEAYTSEEDAFERERALKRFSGSYTHLKKRIGKSLLLSK